MRTRWAEACRYNLLGEFRFQRRPARVCVFEEARRVGGEGVTALLAAEQIEPLAHDQPDARVAGIGDPAPDIDRVVAAEPGTVDLGMGDKRRPVALVAKPPDRTGLGGLEIGQA